MRPGGPMSRTRPPRCHPQQRTDRRLIGSAPNASRISRHQPEHDPSIQRSIWAAASVDQAPSDPPASLARAMPVALRPVWSEDSWNAQLRRAEETIRASPTSSRQPGVMLISLQQPSVGAASPLEPLLPLLSSLPRLNPSRTDRRYRSLLSFIWQQRNTLTPTELCQAAASLRQLDERQMLEAFGDTLVEGVSFFSSDVMASLSRTVAHMQGGRGDSHRRGREEGFFEAVLDHMVVEPDLFAPEDFATSLLSLCMFHYPPPSSSSPPSPPPFSSRLDTAFATCDGLMASDSLPASSLIDLLEAHRLRRGYGVEGDREMYVCAGERLAGSLDDLGAAKVLRGLHALADLVGRRQGDDRMNRVFGLFFRRLDSLYLDLTASDVAMALDAATKLLPQTPSRGDAGPTSRRMLKRLLDGVKRTVGQMGRKHCLTVLRSVKELHRHWVRDADLLSLLEAQVTRELMHLTPAQLAFVVSSFAHMRYATHSSSSSSSNSNDSKANEDFWGLLRGEVAERLPSFEPKHMATSLWGLSKMGAMSRSLFNKAEIYVQQNIMGLSNCDIALTLWSFATMGIQPAPEALAVITAHLHKNVLTFSPTDLTQTLWSFTAFGAHIDPPLLSSFLTCVARQLRHLKTEELVIVAVALTRLGYRQQPILIELYRMVYAVADKLDVHQLAMVFFTFGMSGIRDDALVKRLCFRITQQADRLNPQDLSNILLGLSRLGGRGVTPSFIESMQASSPDDSGQPVGLSMLRPSYPDHDEDQHDDNARPPAKQLWTSAFAAAGDDTSSSASDSPPEAMALPSGVNGEMVSALRSRMFRSDMLRKMASRLLPSIYLTCGALQPTDAQLLMLMHCIVGRLPPPLKDKSRKRRLVAAQDDDMSDQQQQQQQQAKEGVGETSTLMTARAGESFASRPPADTDDLLNYKDMARLLIGAAHHHIIYLPFLDPLCTSLAPWLPRLHGTTLISLVWSLHSLGWSRPKFRWKLGGAIKQKTHNYQIPISIVIEAVLPLDHLGLYHRLDPKLQHEIYNRVDNETRQRLRSPLPIPEKQTENHMIREAEKDEIRIHSIDQLVPIQPDEQGETIPSSQESYDSSVKRQKESLSETGHEAIWHFMQIVRRM
ncbi:unnamed protein product [Vitrella brassicaformis CCMP3155]|uniref:RNA-editing substrate-binding complex 6 protein domain-containing protein n=3 Tax=Vitrella brassicaformis TaxID=1169539 RepID=A0A0G4FVQ3_VITBC|nr:unnamed protein product [Vitrella brassicaformis CCMP3155]|eukprot:CEM19242.1 unnamed protein product [Vitrella brassicaformis CCMP3155]